MAWGKGGSLRSCDALLLRVEEDDPRLTELVVLPMKAFGPADAERLSRAIASGSNTNLRSISASGHALPPESLRRLGLALSAQAEARGKDGETARGITSLAVGSKDMGDEGAIALCEGLGGSGGGLLRSLDFGWKGLGKKGIQAIGATFASSEFLNRLDLSRNADVGDEGVARLAEAAGEGAGAAMSPLPSLEGITLSGCGVGPAGATALAGMISSGQRERLLGLTMGSNPLGPHGLGALAGLCAVPGVGSLLSELRVTACSVGDGGIGLLAAAAMAEPCAGLRVLDISENSVTGSGAMALAESLGGSWPDLAELCLAKNELGGEGVASVMGTLFARDNTSSSGDSAGGDTNSTLRSLDLSRTGCGIPGARAALMSGSLETIRLFDNRLGSEGFHSISPLLQGGHPSIVNLDLGGNNADEGAVVALLNSIADKRDGFTSKLAVLEIGGNKFGDEAMVALTELKRIWPDLDVAHDKPVQDAEEEPEEE